MPALLVKVAERIVVPVTALCDIGPEPCDDSFALPAVGRVFVITLHNRAQAGPDTAQGIAHAVIRFTREILTQITKTSPTSSDTWKPSASAVAVHELRELLDAALVPRAQPVEPAPAPFT